jgi:hypothetical protein
VFCGCQRVFFGPEAALILAGAGKTERLMRVGVISSWHIYTNDLPTGIVYKYMSSLQNDGDKKPTPPDKSTVVLLLGTIGDTTWRMFVPTIGLTVLGLLIDKQLHTTPWIMTIGIIAGASLAYLLVRRQIKKVKQDDK